MNAVTRALTSTSHTATAITASFHIPPAAAQGAVPHLDGLQESRKISVFGLLHAVVIKQYE